MARLTLSGIVKKYADGHTVLHGVDLEIGEGEFLVLVGPSGCGKSTLLRMIAGLEEISEGELQIDGKRANAIDPARRGIAMVFQSYALYPHMTVFENMAFSLQLAGQSKAQVREAVQRAADILQIGHLLERRPKELSGGQRQRVAIGRAIVRKPGVFLFDEPLSNLDASLRVQMRAELARLHRDLKATMVYVTHDQVEAMTLGQRIVVMNAGRIEQVGSPQELYERPATVFVAGFLGTPKMNLLSAQVETPGRLRLASGAVLDLPTHGASAGDSVTLGIRAEHIVPGETGIEAELAYSEYLGDQRLAYTREMLAFRLPASAQAAPGTRMHLAFPPQHCHLFNASGVRFVGQ